MWIYDFAFCCKFGKMLQIHVFRGSAQIITILHGGGLPYLLQYYKGGGSLGTPNLYYVIYERPLTMMIMTMLKGVYLMMMTMVMMRTLMTLMMIWLRELSPRYCTLCHKSLSSANPHQHKTLYQEEKGRKYTDIYHH